MSHSQHHRGESLRSHSHSPAPKTPLRRFDAAQNHHHSHQPTGSRADVPQGSFPANSFPEALPPFSLDPATIGLESLSERPAVEEPKAKTESSRFRLDRADWIPKPHSAAVQRLGQILWNTQAEYQTTPLVDSVSEPFAPISSSSPSTTSKHAGPWSDATTATASYLSDSIDLAPPTTPLKPAWEVDDLLWPAASARLLADQQPIFARMLSAFRDRQADLKVIAVTGLRSDDDRSVLAISLARFIASRGEQVALIDADPMDLSLALRCGLSLQSGWRDFEAADLGEALIRETSSRLLFVPQGVGHALETSIAADSLSLLLQHLRPYQDWIIVDAGSMSGLLALEPTVSPLFDAAVIIRHASSYAAEEIESARRKLVGIGIRLLALADNFGQRRAAG